MAILLITVANVSSSVTLEEVQSVRSSLLLAIGNLPLVQMVQMTRYGTVLLSWLATIMMNYIFMTVWIDGCDSDILDGRKWPETNLGSTATIPCPCADIVGSLAGRVSRLCTGTYDQGAEWDDIIDESQCTALNSEITSRLCAAAMVS